MAGVPCGLPQGLAYSRRRGRGVSARATPAREVACGRWPVRDDRVLDRRRRGCRRARAAAWIRAAARIARSGDQLAVGSGDRVPHLLGPGTRRPAAWVGSYEPASRTIAGAGPLGALDALSAAAEVLALGNLALRAVMPSDQHLAGHDDQDDQHDRDDRERTAREGT